MLHRIITIIIKKNRKKITMWFMYVYKLKAFQTTPNWILFRLTFIIVFFISIRAFFVYTLNARRYSLLPARRAFVNGVFSCMLRVGPGVCLKIVPTRENGEESSFKKVSSANLMTKVSRTLIWKVYRRLVMAKFPIGLQPITRRLRRSVTN